MEKLPLTPDQYLLALDARLTALETLVSGVSPGAEAANTVYAGPATGPAASPTFRALVAADIPATGADTTVTVSRTRSSRE